MDPLRAVPRRDVTLFLAGLVVGILLASLLFSLWLNRMYIRRAITPFLPVRYAAHTCLESAPNRANGAQVWLRNPRPAPEGSTTVCARLVVNGKNDYLSYPPP